MATEPGPAINEAFAKLERALAAITGLWKHRRHLSSDIATS
jgi:hypothetical protein